MQGVLFFWMLSENVMVLCGEIMPAGARHSIRLRGAAIQQDYFAKQPKVKKFVKKLQRALSQAPASIWAVIVLMVPISTSWCVLCFIAAVQWLPGAAETVESACRTLREVLGAAAAVQLNLSLLDAFVFEVQTLVGLVLR